MEHTTSTTPPGPATNSGVPVGIRLNRKVWQYWPSRQLGAAGGFGSVYFGRSEDGRAVAVKRLHGRVDQLGHREQEMAALLASRDLQYVIPVLDAGQDAQSDGYFIVMEKAQHSLEDELDKLGVFSQEDAVAILNQITKGLLEVDDIVHRDLKPANVLFHEGQWKLSDFGIARFIEAATSANTLKECLSPEFAAPEQWLGERATHATDVYALGCIAYALLAGTPPFQGSADELRRHHLESNPRSLGEIAPRLRSLLACMLRKTAQTRPSLTRLRSQLEDVLRDRPFGEGGRALAEAAGKVAEQQAEREAEGLSRAAASERRARIAQDANSNLAELRKQLLSEVCQLAPDARSEYGGRSVGEALLVGRVVLGAGCLELRLEVMDPLIKPDAFPRSGWDVVAGASIEVRQGHPEYRWGASLWYTNRGEANEYRWWEASYFVPLGVKPPRHEPFAAENYEQADLAAAPVFAAWNHAEEPMPIDHEDFPMFVDRWAKRLALASEGKLERPRHLPV